MVEVPVSEAYPDFVARFEAEALEDPR